MEEQSVPRFDNNYHIPVAIYKDNGIIILKNFIKQEVII